MRISGPPCLFRRLRTYLRAGASPDPAAADTASGCCSAAAAAGRSVCEVGTGTGPQESEAGEAQQGDGAAADAAGEAAGAADAGPVGAADAGGAAAAKEGARDPV